jgi:hypothetical protein
MNSRRLAICATILLGALSQTGRAEEGKLPDAILPSPGQPQITEWIKQLDSDRFAERTEASHKLQAAGVAAIDALTKAATAESREVMLRALEVLKHHFTEGNEAEKKAARAALESLAAGEHPSVSARAKLALQPPAPPQPANLIPMGRVQIQMQVKGQNKRRIRIDAQGRHIEAEENGRQIKIDVWKDGSIDVAVTESKEGKQVTKKYKAKNEAELKKQHPEAYKLYAEQNVAMPQLRIQIGPGVPPALPKR